MLYKYLDAAALRGETITEICQIGNDRIELATASGKRYAMYHEQDCCESVTIHDIKGDLQSLVGHTLQVAEEATSNEWPADVAKPKWEPDSVTWSTYTFETLLDKVVIRWLGESNGYYSELVQISELA